MPPGELVTVPEPLPYRLTWSVNFVFAADGVAAPTASVAAAAIASSRPSAPRRAVLESAAVSPTASPWLLNDPKPGPDLLSRHQDGLRGRPRPDRSAVPVPGLQEPQRVERESARVPAGRCPHLEVEVAADRVARVANIPDALTAVH